MGRTKPRVCYPTATIAFYGPDDVRATKVVVGVIRHEGAEPDLRRWMSGSEDVRHSRKIGTQILAFLKASEVKSVVMTGGIIGCVHEEGIDYPEGTRCPFCRFWSEGERAAP